LTRDRLSCTVRLKVEIHVIVEAEPPAAEVIDQGIIHCIIAGVPGKGVDVTVCMAVRWSDKHYYLRAWRDQPREIHRGRQLRPFQRPAGYRRGIPGCPRPWLFMATGLPRA